MARLQWRLGDGTRTPKVTTLELFFDLVFVLTLTQLARILEHDLTLAGAARVFLMFAVLWYMYGGYVWLTNHVSPMRSAQRLVLLAGMAGFLLCSVSIAHVLDGTGVLFGVGYVIVTVVHVILFTQSEVSAPLARLALFNLTSAGFVLAAGSSIGRFICVTCQRRMLAGRPLLT